jgi:hypothetical protein
VPFFESYVTTDSVQAAYTKVLNGAGAIRPRRDAIDTRIVDEVDRRSFTYRGGIENLPGIIDSQADVGGYPVLKNGPAPADSDHDGLPDWWELQYGLNPQSAPGDFSDTNSDPDEDGYTQMDNYLEYLAQEGFQFGSFNCTEAIAADLNGDCKVTFDDFEMFAKNWQHSAGFEDMVQFASQWLDCNREPASECR